MVTQEEVVEKLKTIIDPHTGQSMYDMNLISDIEVKEEEVTLTFEPSSPYCPIGVQLAQAIKGGVESIKGVSKAKVTVKGHVMADKINEELCNAPE
ncbi:MAG: iron-sulfur cluster assembly protein [Dehalococcoidia bacterium]